jgi:serine phosphatase RsbU (regulator of sigma subunit)
MPLGVGNCEYAEADFPFPAGETLVLYTDGLIESRNGNEFFGEDRVAAVLSVEDCDNVQRLVETLVSRATEFAGGRLRDDLAVMAVRYRRGGP